MSQVCLSCSTKIRENFHWAKLFSFGIFQENLFPPLHEWICSLCLEEVQLIQGQTCQLCSRLLADLDKAYIYDYQDSNICYDCLRWLEWSSELGFEITLKKNSSALVYNSWMEQMINRYKFRGDIRLKYFFTSLLIGIPDVSELLRKIDVVISIPLSAQRLGERGFNQAGLLARLFGEYYGLAYAEDWLIRLPDGNEKQSKKGRTERLADLLQKFIKNETYSVDIVNKQILLIDDIYTTGATLHAAAYTLLEAGARDIYSLTVAR